MKTINLKDYYPYYTQDTYVEVSDELFAIFEESVRAEGVSKKAVRIGIERGLHTIEKYLKSFF